LNHKKKVQVLFGYYAILQANLAGLEKRCRKRASVRRFSAVVPAKRGRFCHEVD
jgi:hypothetical protein